MEVLEFIKQVLFVILIGLVIYILYTRLLRNWKNQLAPTQLISVEGVQIDARGEISLQFNVLESSPVEIHLLVDKKEHKLFAKQLKPDFYSYKVGNIKESPELKAAYVRLSAPGQKIERRIHF
ncbi:MAG: hypothetical protein ACXITV_07380 [Luteibaculaceae bacterium]